MRNGPSKVRTEPNTAAPQLTSRNKQTNQERNCHICVNK